MVRVPSSRTSTHPGDLLLKEFLIPLQVTRRELANSLHLRYRQVNAMVNGQIDITPSTALRLAKFFGISAEFRLNLQFRWDLYVAQQDEASILQEIKSYSTDGR